MKRARHLIIVAAILSLAYVGVVPGASFAQEDALGAKRYYYKCKEDELIIPSGYSSVLIHLAGAQGDHASGSDSGGSGYGGYVEATAPVKAGQRLLIVAGCQHSGYDSTAGGPGGRGWQPDPSPPASNGGDGGGQSFVLYPFAGPMIWQVVGGGGGGAGGQAAKGFNGKQGGTGGHGGRTPGDGSHGGSFSNGTATGGRGGAVSGLAGPGGSFRSNGGGGGGGGGSGCSDGAGGLGGYGGGGGGGGGTSCAKGSGVTKVSYVDGRQHGSGIVQIWLIPTGTGDAPTPTTGPSATTTSTTSTTTTTSPSTPADQLTATNAVPIGTTLVSLRPAASPPS
jgi:hypothetical protein